MHFSCKKKLSVNITLADPGVKAAIGAQTPLSFKFLLCILLHLYFDAFKRLQIQNKSLLDTPRPPKNSGISRGTMK